MKKEYYDNKSSQDEGWINSRYPNVIEHKIKYITDNLEPFISKYISSIKESKMNLALSKKTNQVGWDKENLRWFSNCETLKLNHRIIENALQNYKYGNKELLNYVLLTSFNQLLSILIEYFKMQKSKWSSEIEKARNLLMHITNKKPEKDEKYLKNQNRHLLPFLSLGYYPKMSGPLYDTIYFSQATFSKIQHPNDSCASRLINGYEFPLIDLMYETIKFYLKIK